MQEETPSDGPAGRTISCIQGGALVQSQGARALRTGTEQRLGQLRGLTSRSVAPTVTVANPV
jgi:hypothetical protein